MVGRRLVSLGCVVGVFFLLLFVSGVVLVGRKVDGVQELEGLDFLDLGWNYSGVVPWFR